MRIQYASDLHLEFAENWRFLRDNPIQVTGDILVLAGDIDYLGDKNYQKHPFWDWASDNYQQVIIVLGNHEFYKFYDLSTMRDGTVGEIRENIHYYYNKVIKIGDVDFILSTLWSRIEEENAPYTEQCVTDFRRIMYGKNIMTHHEFNQEHNRCLQFIKQAVKESTAKYKVVVTHHVPSYQLCATEFEGSALNGAFTVELEDYIMNSEVDYWIYAHSHRNINKVIGKTHCISNQLGYVFANEHLTFDARKAIIVP
jgi:predicted phosphodiesterase